MEDSDNNACRICFDEDSSHDPLIIPCNCRGTSRYVHASCIVSWISQTTSTLQETCEVCKSRYNFLEILPVKIRKSSKYPNLCCILFIIIMILTLFVVLFCILTAGHTIDPSSNFKTFVVALIFFLLAFMCLIGLSAKIVKIICKKQAGRIYRVVQAFGEVPDDNTNSFVHSLFRSENGEVEFYNLGEDDRSRFDAGVN